MSIDTILFHANKVMHELGVGHRETIYAKALNVALNQLNIPHRSEVDIPIMYMNQCIGHGRADLIVGDVIIEIKAVYRPPKEAMGQLQKYVENLTRVEKVKYKGMILNFCQNTGLTSVFMYHNNTGGGKYKPITEEPVQQEGKRSRFFPPKTTRTASPINKRARKS